MSNSINIYKCHLIKESSHKYHRTISAVSDAVKLSIDLGFASFSDEVFGIFCLNTKGALAGFHEVSHGTLNSASVHPRDVFKRALINNAASVILIHNHPSGDPTPSAEDIFVTKRLSEIGELFGIPIIDHIIIGENSSYYSLKSNNDM